MRTLCNSLKQVADPFFRNQIRTHKDQKGNIEIPVFCRHCEFDDQTQNKNDDIQINKHIGKAVSLHNAIFRKEIRNTEINRNSPYESIDSK